ncbi:MAG: NADH-quinone oxidoreductase subunit NuoK [Vicinamibacteria bacterium]|nr:NADH-quinone oxidoreductase subunit NuoK [Vicinamibacteria bacterium]
MSETLLRHALALSLALFAVGAVGVLLRRNVITVLMCIELMLNAANLALVAFSRSWAAVDGHVMALFVLTVAASEAAVGLAIVIALQRARDTLDVDAFDELRG